ncbi:EAL domain-containing protein [Bacillus sp. FJAT-18017]|uniref:EAL domain-containing protein n=1 Tax=Bacillus sp. FJAT-18017 TaxID=1705566 RepID=UPI0006AE8D2A|nr:EAL domain-containing protein [Bacillus sp. FJAT-18017]
MKFAEKTSEEEPFNSSFTGLDNDFQNIFGELTNAVFILDRFGRVLTFNKAATNLFGFHISDMFEVSTLFLDHNHERNELHKKIVLEGKAQHYTAAVKHKNGFLLTVGITCIPLFNEKNEVVKVCAIIQNSTESKNNQKEISQPGTIHDKSKLKAVENNFFESAASIKNIYDNLDAAIWSFDMREGRISFISKGIKAITGYSPDEIMSIGWNPIIHPGDLDYFNNMLPTLVKGLKHSHQYRIIHKSGEIRWIDGHTIPILGPDGTLARIDGIMSDITKQKLYEKQILYHAHYDGLTGLPNRRKFDEKIQSLCQTSITQKKTGEELFSILYLDLDRFQNIIDTLGQPVAEKLLIRFSERLSPLICGSSLLARLDSDEFGVIVWGIDSAQEAINLAKNIIDSTRDSAFSVDGFDLHITASIGISMYPFDGSEPGTLLKKASAAMYRAKEKGKNDFQLYTPSLNIGNYKLFIIERDLRKAINTQELFLHFQPRIDAKTGRILSAEALIRWEHPKWGMISPGEFIPIAEETDLVLQIGDFVIKKVCAFLRDWKANGLPVVPISINVSSKRFLKADWVNKLEQILDDHQIPSHLIELEITESAIIKHKETVDSAIKSLKKLGVRVALDDFGTGYSSLTYLKQFQVDTLKIDKSFIDNVTKSPQDQLITKAMISLAQGMNMNVVAEGVETPEQLDFLKGLECNEIQGYLFSRPVAIHDFENLLKKQYLEPEETFPSPSSTSERRSHQRIQFSSPKSAKISLISVGGKPVQVGCSNVDVMNIGLGGLKFVTGMNLPLRNDHIFQFEFEISDTPIVLTGTIVWKQEVKDIFHYGISFIHQCQEKVLNDLLKS